MTRAGEGLTRRGRFVPEPYVLPPGETARFFPLKLQIAASLTEDFEDAQLVYETRGKIHEDQGGYPLRVITRDVDARFIRISIPLGHYRGDRSMAALSEVVVLSGGEPVSFGATVEATQSLNSPEKWQPEFIIDGRTPA